MKKLLGYFPFHFVCFLVLGIVLQHYLSLWSFGNFYLLISFLVLLALLFIIKSFKGFQILLFAFYVFVGIFTTFLSDYRNKDSYFEKFLKYDSLKELRVTKIEKPTNYYTKYTAEVTGIDSSKTNGKILINIQKDSLQKALQVGQFLYTKIHFKEVNSPLNPHQFNYKNYLAKQGIYKQIFLQSNDFISKNEFKNSISRAAYLIRIKIQQSLLQHHFAKDSYAVMNALLLGQRQDISKKLVDNYAKAGAIHILAVSGLHVGIILLILNTIFKPLERFKRGRILKAFLIVLVLWTFAIVAGLSASVVRAVTMFSMVALGQLFKKRNSVEHSLIVSMLLLLLVNPIFLFDVGFQLSYLAVFGIVWIQPKLYSIWKPRWKIVNFYWKLVTVSIAAQLVVLPISLFYFHQFPGLFIVSNLVIIPFLGAILIGGIFIFFLSLLDILPTILVDLYSDIISGMNHFVQWISHQESWLFTQISFSWRLLVFSYLVIVLGYQFFTQKRGKQLVYGLMAVVVFQSALWFEKWESSFKSEFIIFHKTRHSIVGERYGNKTMVYSTLNQNQFKKERMIASYSVAEKVDVSLVDSIPKYFEINNQPILLIDKQIEHLTLSGEAPIIVLINSPKINLERLINQLKPKQIIADGSNYKSTALQWQNTCKKTKTPFWYTGQKGAYTIK